MGRQDSYKNEKERMYYPQNTLALLSLMGVMDRMNAIQSEFEVRVQRWLFAAAAPIFENILHKR